VKRIRRFFANTLAALSVVMFLVALGFWVRSFRHADQVSFEATGMRGEYFACDSCFVSSVQGVVHFGASQYPVDDDGQAFKVNAHAFRASATDLHDAIDTDSPSERWRFRIYRRYAGFGYWQTVHMGEDVRALTIPHWTVALLAAVWTIIALRRRAQRTGRHRHGLCVRCGYDLRATPDRCPECGAASGSSAVFHRPNRYTASSTTAGDPPGAGTASSITARASAHTFRKC
jgi:hypothetical protein